MPSKTHQGHLMVLVVLKAYLQLNPVKPQPQPSKKEMMPTSFSCTSQQKKWHCCFLEMIRKPLQGDAFQGPKPRPKPRNFSRTPFGVQKTSCRLFESLLPNQIALHSAGSLENESSPKNGKGNQHANPC